MIKFFRNIRQRLLSNNKFTKYLLYTIGEIFLVVIGILIALQVNNWNEQKKSKEKELNILRELRTDLIQNKYKLNHKIELFKITQRDGKLIEEHIVNKRAYNDSLQRYLSVLLNNFSFLLSYSAYENLKSQGFDNISNDQLRLNIIRLYNDEFGLISDQEIKITNIFTNTIVPITIKYFKTTEDKGFIPNDWNKLLSTTEYTNLLSQLIFVAGNYEDISKNTIIAIDELLIEIESELNK